MPITGIYGYLKKKNKQIVNNLLKATTDTQNNIEMNKHLSSPTIYDEFAKKIFTLRNRIIKCKYNISYFC